MQTVPSYHLQQSHSTHLVRRMLDAKERLQSTLVKGRPPAWSDGFRKRHRFGRLNTVTKKVFTQAVGIVGLQTKGPDNTCSIGQKQHARSMYFGPEWISQYVRLLQIKVSCFTTYHQHKSLHNATRRKVNQPAHHINYGLHDTLCTDSPAPHKVRRITPMVNVSIGAMRVASLSQRRARAKAVPPRSPASDNTSIERGEI